MNLIKKEDVHLRAKMQLIDISAAPNNCDKKEWGKIFAIQNETKESWEKITYKCEASPACRAQINELAVSGRYQEFIRPEPNSFFQSIAQVFHIMSDNLSLIKEVETNNKRVHIPFRSTLGKMFVVQFLPGTPMRAIIRSFPNFIIWNAEHGRIILLPQYQN